MASLIVKITGDASGFKGAMDGANKALDSVAVKAEKVSGAIGSLGNTLTVGLTAPILAMGAGVIKTAADMESLRLGLASVAKGADTTEVQLKRLKEVAKLPGLGFSEAIQGSVRLQSAGFSAQLAERSLKAFGNALATVGKGKADLDGVTLALSQIASKGKISAEEINQLAERVPQIRVAMKAAFGTADTEVLQKAGIGAEEFVTRVVAQLEKLKQVSGGTKNSLENLTDAFKESADRIGSKMLPAVNEILPKLEQLAVAAADAVDGFVNLPKEVQNTALALGAVAIAAGPVIKAFQGIQAGLISIRAVAGLAGLAMGALFGATVFAGVVKTMSAIDQLRAKTKAYYDDLDRLRTGKQDIIAGQENAGLGGVRTRESFITPEQTNVAAKYKIDLAAISAELGILTTKTKEATPEVRDLTKELQKGSDAIKVRSVADLIYVESLQRMKTAVEKAKDIMYEWSIQGTSLGKQMETWKAPISAMKLEFESMSDAIWTATENMKMLSALPPPQVEISKQGLENQSRVGITGANNAAKTLGFETDQQRYQRLKNLESALDDVRAAYERGQATGTDLAKAQEAYNKAAQEGTRVSRDSSAAMKQVSLVITDLSRGITDAIFSGKSLGEVMKNVAIDSAKAITRYLIEGSLKKLADSLLGVGNTSKNVFGGIASAIGGLFGGGSKGASPIFSAASSSGSGLSGMLGGAGSAGGAAGGVGGAAGSAAGAGATAIVGAVSGVVSAISGVISNFQFAHMNTALGRIEESTRYVKIWTGEQSQNLLWCAQKSTEYLGYAVKSLDQIGLLNSQMLGLMQSGAAGGGATINMAGAYFLTDSAMDDFIDRFARRMKVQGL